MWAYDGGMKNKYLIAIAFLMTACDVQSCLDTQSEPAIDAALVAEPTPIIVDAGPAEIIDVDVVLLPLDAGLGEAILLPPEEGR